MAFFSFDTEPAMEDGGGVIVPTNVDLLHLYTYLAGAKMEMEKGRRSR
jgi:hypothetical protein